MDSSRKDLVFLINLVVTTVLPCLIYFSLAVKGWFVIPLVLSVLFLVQISRLFKMFRETRVWVLQILSSLKNKEVPNLSGHKSAGDFSQKVNSIFSQVINQYKSLRQNFEEQKLFLSLMVDQLAVGVLVHDEYGKVILSNKAFSKIASSRRMTDLSMLQQQKPEMYDEIINARYGKFILKCDKTSDSQIYSVNKSRFITMAAPLVLLTFQDIQQEMEENELESWNVLLRVLTHEIMNSITPVISLSTTSLELARQLRVHEESAENFKDMTDALAVIEKRGQALLSFVRKYRTLLKVPEPEKQVFQISGLLYRIVLLLRNQLDEAGIELVVRINPETLVVRADAGQIEQVLINLILNAAEALANVGYARKLDIVVTDEQGIKICVIDNGPGIDIDALNNIFVPFFTTKKQGSGIGLALARRIAQLHNGTLSVDSNNPGQTCFCLRLPYADGSDLTGR